MAIDNTVIYSSVGNEYAVECPYCEIIERFPTSRQAIMYGLAHKDIPVHKENVKKADRGC